MSEDRIVTICQHDEHELVGLGVSGVLYKLCTEGGLSYWDIVTPSPSSDSEFRPSDSKIDNHGNLLSRGF